MALWSSDKTYSGEGPVVPRDPLEIPATVLYAAERSGQPRLLNHSDHDSM